ncbi:MAG: hypothetical protein A2X25_03595 [Chloroflexi bacterium GWB2_49_20]|nr:MAG: hypothetical protein A2X25_03595 [Chloroflexi bacterium GWB2_49_20]OGN76672.1 MAG: hypothetical protein A2X26_10685 [Chloroflexi bacterium GWC2_49_37]OGN83632.1 MAG: hypothetical protein A2X27_01340 [Chloroflexi bacterium GWD2_49_16]
MLFFIISIVLLALFIYEIFIYFSSLNNLERVLALFLATSAYLVFIFELAGLLNSINTPFIILSIQFFICCFVFIINQVLGHQYMRFKIDEFRDLYKTTKTNIKNNLGIFFYASFIFIVYLFLLYIEIRFPQNTTDSLYNHLSKIGYWLQQGSLKTYFGFSNYGTTYPYNNSLLMLWSVVFLRSDKLVGLVQYIATFILALSIYLTGNELGFSKKGNAFAALLTLTFPIIIFESITAQNDILVASFLMVAFYFLLRNLHTGNKYFLIFSILSYSLAIGTKQNALFALPGYVSLYLFSIIKNKYHWKSMVFLSICCTFIFTLFFGAFAYLQNWISFGTPVGKVELFQQENSGAQGSLLDKVVINSVRASYQFLSCEGIPPQAEIACTRTKTAFFRPILNSNLINVETPNFLLEPDELFKLDKLYSLNEESSWYGLHGWLIILPSILLGLIYSIKNKKTENLIIFSAGFVFFIISTSFKPGWDPYVGRYLIFSTALIIPFVSLLFGTRNKLIKLFIYSVCLFSLLSMVYCVLNNDSRPLISNKMFTDMQIWGRNNSILVQKIGYKLSPLARHDNDSWSLDQIALRTYANKSYSPVIRMVNKFLSRGSSIGILAFPALVPDYYFFGDTFDREIIPVTSLEKLNSLESELNFLLVSPDFLNESFPGYSIISSENEWRLFMHNK